MMFHTFTEFLIRKTLKRNFSLDRRIPSLYLLGMIMEKGVALIRGVLLFRCCIPVFVHSGTVVKCKSQIHFGAGLQIARQCYIDALSIEGITCGNNVSIGFCTYYLRFRIFTKFRKRNDHRQ